MAGLHHHCSPSLMLVNLCRHGSNIWCGEENLLMPILHMINNHIQCKVQMSINFGHVVHLHLSHTLASCFIISMPPTFLVLPCSLELCTQPQLYTHPHAHIFSILCSLHISLPFSFLSLVLLPPLFISLFLSFPPPFCYTLHFLDVW